MLGTFIAITLIFFLAILTHTAFRIRLCAICVSVAVSWLGLLILYKLDKFQDPVLLALLMGQTIAGLFYTLKDRVPKELRIFTLPFFLTFTTVFYALITNRLILPALALTALLWTAGWLLFASHNDPGRKDLANAAMECCDGEK